MLFNSYIFIFAFLPICLAGYHILKKRCSQTAKVWLILFSLWFYGYFNIRYLAIMVGSVLINFAVFKAIQKSERYRKTVFILGILINLGVLFYFKYFDFFIENINVVFKTQIPLKHILLPLGISFFTFQQISFLHDVYDEKITGVGFIDYALFITFFPQLIAGPIVTAKEMLPQFDKAGEKELNADMFAGGIYIFVMGLAKKVLIADVLSKAVDFGYADVFSLTGAESVLVSILYTFQLYFDFSGYCDMAIGIGRMFGINIAQNFNSPYKSHNIVEFWKRWHITLSRFFTRNIYIPLGGNREGKVKMFRNLFIVFFLSGLWHGAGWNFILWGCMHGVLYVITRAYLMHRSEKDYVHNDKKTVLKITCDALSVILTFTFVNIAWIFFRAPSLNEATAVLANMFTGGFTVSDAFLQTFNKGEFWYIFKILHLTNAAFGKYLVMCGYLTACFIMAFFMPNVHEAHAKMKFNGFHAIICGVVFLWCIVSLSGVGTFLYFNF